MFPSPVVLRQMALLAAVIWGALGHSPLQAGLERPEETISVRGHVVCLDRDHRTELDPDRCNDPEGGARFALHGDDGRLYHFSADDPKARMFVDPRVRERYLEVTGWLREEDRLEIHEVYSLKEGRLHHIHYRCEVCDITATAPGPCWCCQQEFELRESPVEGEGGAPAGGDASSGSP